jgi:hypothetical protein
MVFVHDGGDRMRGRKLHRRVDRLGAHVERAPEDSREGENVVDLIRVIGASGRKDRDLALTSGVGFAIANTIASFAIVRTAFASTAPG